jgi:hypothetical protein
MDVMTQIAAATVSNGEIESIDVPDKPDGSIVTT